MRFGQVQDSVVGRNDDAVRAFDLRLLEDLSDRAIRIYAVYSVDPGLIRSRFHRRSVSEIDAPFAVDSEVVRAAELFALVAFGEPFHAAGLDIRSGNARAIAVGPTLACEQPAFGVKNQARCAVLPKDLHPAGRLRQTWLRLAARSVGPLQNPAAADAAKREIHAAIRRRRGSFSGREDRDRLDLRSGEPLFRAAHYSKRQEQRRYGFHASRCS